MSHEGRLRATYDLVCEPGEDPGAKALDIAREQTVEMPEGAPPPDVERRVLGVVEELTSLPDGRFRTVVSHDLTLLDDGLAQLFNLVFGNISMKQGIRLVALDLPDEVVRRYHGPRFGIPGLRALTGVPDRPILSTALKPVGLSASALGDIAYRFARAGLDIIKDDHSLADQRTAPYRERVDRCQAAVNRANGEIDGDSLYFPNVSGPIAGLTDRLDYARDAGCRGVLINVIAQGVDAVPLAASRGLAVLAHPSMSGAFFGGDHGITPEVLYGDLFRLAGADGVIYPNPEGRFPGGLWSIERCHAINERLRGRLGEARPAFPVPAGGIDVARVAEWLSLWGPDTVFLIGGSLYARGDYEVAAHDLVVEVQRHHDRLAHDAPT